MLYQRREQAIASSRRWKSPQPSTLIVRVSVSATSWRDGYSITQHRGLCGEVDGRAPLCNNLLPKRKGRRVLGGSLKAAQLFLDERDHPFPPSLSAILDSLEREHPGWYF